jgi:PRC-barrel domain
MRKSCRAAMAVLVMTAAAHAAGQGSRPLPPQRAQDDAIQEPQKDPQKPNDTPADAKPTVTVFDRLEVQGILGKEVRSEANENMGRIVDVIVDRSGQVRAAIIDFGGFLGVGNRKVAVAWNALRFPPDPKDPKKVGRIGLDLSREQVQAAPEYKEDKPVVVLGASGGLESLPFP